MVLVGILVNRNDANRLDKRIDRLEDKIEKRMDSLGDKIDDLKKVVWGQKSA
jgi:tetrahydromethanopterin S-methyltransferase subunit G